MSQEGTKDVSQAQYRTDMKPEDTLLIVNSETKEVQQVEVSKIGRTLEFDTVEDLRSMNSNDKELLRSGVVKSARLLGYYKKGDLPFYTVNYYISDSDDPDDGGSTFVIGDLKLQAYLGDNVDTRYFGAFPDSVTEASVNLQAGVEYLKRIGGGDLVIPTHPIYSMLVNYTVYINKAAAIPITIRGGNAIGKSATQWENRGSSIVATRSTTIFRTNMKENGRPYKGKDDYCTNVSFKNLSFVAGSDDIDVIAIENYRTRQLVENVSGQNLWAVVLQDENPPAGMPANEWDNYCDSSIYRGVTISFPKKHGIRTTHNDQGIYEFITTNYPRQTCENILYIHYSFGITVRSLLFAQLDMPNLPVSNTSALVHMKLCTAFDVQGGHIEKCTFNSAFYLDRCFSGTISGFHERFYGRNFIKTQGCKKLKYENMHILSTRMEGYYDVFDSVEFGSSNVYYNNIWASNYTDSDWQPVAERELILNKPRTSTYMSLMSNKMDTNPAIVEMRNGYSNLITKVGALCVTNYELTKSPVDLITGVSSQFDDSINIGGGSSARVAATQISFFSARFKGELIGENVGGFNGSVWYFNKPFRFNGVMPAGNQFAYYRNGGTAMSWKSDNFPELLSSQYNSPTTNGTLTTLYSYVMPANYLAVGDFLEINSQLSIGVSSGTKILVDFGAINLYTSNVFNGLSATSSASIKIKMIRYITGGAKLHVEQIVDGLITTTLLELQGLRYDEANDIKLRAQTGTGVITGFANQVTKFKIYA
ncbi:hypothetical protein [Sphingobacterium psychroaquaticum]|uniref:Pectate lyase superfamily protein n=1 Tax=Sphingobacterium psychroaquaticum TaxID=561061 RepID=A0A1X7K430_9SPHI|nr:hypothetical protein [Sphingobacterium psychroaquaticum]SMG35352.1 hypothetical protein SAMN05660862_2515 [Sphingobacterium psychroaquaticum]